jgi:peptidoglycan/xylan/chitin deacetylase (PgdA/CDA1 family)
LPTSKAGACQIAIKKKSTYLCTKLATMWYPVRTPFYIKLLFPGLLCTLPKTDKAVLYLSFDDGPNSGVTPWVLDTLKKYNAKATFFCIGKKVETNPEIYSQILAQGHSVGNHSYSHPNGWKTGFKKYIEDVGRCAKSVNSRLFRPPYGRIGLRQMSALQKKNYQIVLWDVLSGDFDPKLSKEQCLKNVLQNSKNGSIIVFHDSEKAFEKLSFVLPLILEHFLNLGFEFKAI